MQGFQEPELMVLETEEEVEHIDATLDDIFSLAFMTQHTQVKSIGEFFVSGGFMPEDMQDICELPREELDAYVQQQTDFDNWNQMLNNAVDELLTRMGYI